MSAVVFWQKGGNMNVSKAAEMQKWALKYLDAGLSVIPVGQNKKPLIKWEKYQATLPTKKEILEWWLQYPDANIAVVTGAISNKCVVDIDDPELKHALLDSIEKQAEPPISSTPRGGRHQWFACPKNEVRNTTGFIPHVDFRGEGGYVLVPPSTNGNGKGYAWTRSIFDADLPILPDSLVNLINGGSRYPKIMQKTQENQPIVECQHPVSTLTNADTCSQLLTHGRRDDDLFHIANCLVKGGARDEEIMQIIKVLASQCNPPFPVGEAFEKIKSALNRTERKEKTATEEIRQWCQMQDGFFFMADICSSLGLSSRTEKNAAYTAVKRLVKEGVIEKYGSKTGCYRKIDDDVSEMDWESAPIHDLDIDYPLGIDQLVQTYPSNIIIVAGTSNSGKTTFMLDLARRNCKKFNVNYFNSEMGLSELRMRLELFQNSNKDEWKRIKFFERGDNFDDVIRPDDINIIDYLEVLDDFWKIGQQIKAIHSKLNQGIAVIAIQKNRGAELGRGGALGTEKPRLYINMDFGKLKIIKAKNWRTHENPNNLCIDFNVAGGWKMIPDDRGWYNE